MAAVVIFDMRQKRFCPWDLAEPIPKQCHQASLGVFNGPYAFKGAARAANEMQETYDGNPEPWRTRRSQLREIMAELFRMGKVPSDFAED